MYGQYNLFLDVSNEIMTPCNSAVFYAINYLRVAFPIHCNNMLTPYCSYSIVHLFCEPSALSTGGLDKLIKVRRNLIEPSAVKRNF